ncbi:MAG: carbohydrate kinase family protein [Stackebrandtia sp.]
MILVCGENVVDVLPGSDGRPRPAAGGGPANTAVALARLGVPTGFAARLGGDAHAALIAERLAAAGVSSRFLTRTDAPSATATVVFDAEGQAEYRFALKGAADFGWRAEELPSAAALAGSVEAVHLGSLAAYLSPGADVLESWVGGIRDATMVSFDPNIRPAVGDAAAARARTESYAALCHLMRASAEDLRFLYGDESPESVARRWLEAGARLVVVTDGERGATAYHDGGRVSAAPPAVSVVDTVGAGDTFNAALLAFWRSRGALSADDFPDVATLAEALRYGYAASALTCTRVGADPPTADEVAAFSAARDGGS